MKELLYYYFTHFSNIGWPAIRSALNPFYGDQVGTDAGITSIWQQLLRKAQAKILKFASSATMQQAQQLQVQLAQQQTQTHLLILSHLCLSFSDLNIS